MLSSGKWPSRASRRFFTPELIASGENACVLRFWGCWRGSALRLSRSPASAQTADKPAQTPSPPGAKAYFVDLKDGATIGPTTTLHFGLEGMGVAPAGIAKPNTGHFHLLIDTDLAAKDEPIPNNENNLHYGAGQTQATVTLAPGKHTLQLVMGDANHVPHNPPVMSPVIHVTVAEKAPAPAAAAPTAERRAASFAGERQSLYRIARQRRLCADDLHRELRPERNGRRAGRVRQAELRATTISSSTRRCRRSTSRSPTTRTICTSAPGRRRRASR